MGPYLSSPDKTKHSEDGSGAKVSSTFYQDNNSSFNNPSLSN